MDSDQRMRGGKRELQLQGPRPTPLKISKESHKIRKEVVAPAYQRPQPVIIYTQSPKIIHIEAHNFMTLVQRLTGSTTHRPILNKGVATAVCNSSSPSSSSTSSSRSCNEKQEEEQGFVKSSHLTPPALSPFSPNFLLPSPQQQQLLQSPGNSMFQDVPLFTPNFDSFFYSPAHFYRLSEPVSMFTLPPSSSVTALAVAPSPTAKSHPQTGL